MTEGRPHTTTSAWRERLVALRNVPPVLGILWQSGRAVVSWGIILRILVAALPAGIGVVAANIVYTAAAVVAAELVPMTGAGVAATLASGVYTAFFAGLQYLGVRRLEA